MIGWADNIDVFLRYHSVGGLFDCHDVGGLFALHG